MTAGRTVECEYTWRLRCNDPAGWRQRVGHWLHRLAECIDGRRILAVEISSVPTISRVQRAEIELSGVRHMEVMLADTVGAEAIELIARDIRPDLYEARP